MTVREAFELAYGPMHEGSECYMLFWYGAELLCGACSLLFDGTVLEHGGGISNAVVEGAYVEGPDISDRPATSFIGFFDKKYDEVVKAQCR